MQPDAKEGRGCAAFVGGAADEAGGNALEDARWRGSLEPSPDDGKGAIEDADGKRAEDDGRRWSESSQRSAYWC
jgi:hypothetical protein